MNRASQKTVGLLLRRHCPCPSEAWAQGSVSAASKAPVPFQCPPHTWQPTPQAQPSKNTDPPTFTQPNPHTHPTLSRPWHSRGPVVSGGVMEQPPACTPGLQHFPASGHHPRGPVPSPVPSPLETEFFWKPNAPCLCCVDKGSSRSPGHKALLSPRTPEVEKIYPSKSSSAPWRVLCPLWLWPLWFYFYYISSLCLQREESIRKTHFKYPHKILPLSLGYRCYRKNTERAFKEGKCV